MMPTNLNMPDAAAGPQLNCASVISPAGEIGSGESKFAAIVNKVIEGQNAAVNGGEDSGLGTDLSNILITGNTLPGSRDLSQTQDAFLNLLGQEVSPQPENHTDQKQTDKNGLSMGSLLFSMIRTAAGENAEGLGANLIEQVDDDTQINNQAGEGDAMAYCGHGLKAGLMLNDLKGMLANSDSDAQTEETSSGTEDNTADRNGLKMGELIYSMMRNVVEDGAEDVDLFSQRGGDAEHEAQACKPEAKEISERGLKAGLFINKHGNDDKQIAGGKADTEAILTALNQEESGDKADSIFSKLSELAERNNSNSNEPALRKSSHDKRDSAAFNLPDNNRDAGINKDRTGLEAAIIRELKNNEAPIQGANDSAKTAKSETTSGNANMFNHSGITPETGKQSEVIFPGNAARPSGFNQILDNVVYVIKSNSKLGVTVEHEGLGKVNINLNMEKGVLNVQINTTEKTVREFIENNVQQIVDSLAKDGVSIGGFSVSLKDHKDNGGEKFIAYNNNFGGNQEQEITREEAKISAVSGLVNVFA